MIIQGLVRGIEGSIHRALGRTSQWTRERLTALAESETLAKVDLRLALIMGKAQKSGEYVFLNEKAKFGIDPQKYPESAHLNRGTIRVSSPSVKKLLKKMEESAR